MCKLSVLGYTESNALCLKLKNYYSQFQLDCDAFKKLKYKAILISSGNKISANDKQDVLNLEKLEGMMKKISEGLNGSDKKQEDKANVLKVKTHKDLNLDLNSIGSNNNKKDTKKQNLELNIQELIKKTSMGANTNQHKMKSDPFLAIEKQLYVLIKSQN